MIEDIRILIDKDVTESIFYNDRIHYIIHAASLVSRNDFTGNPVNVISVNVNGTWNMLELAREKEVEGFLYLSSREIYGETATDKRFIKEDDYGAVNPTLVRSCYPESKRMAENLCACYSHQYSMPVTIARLGHVYGPEYSLASGRVWEEFIQMAVAGKDIVLNSDGKTELALTYVADAVSGLFFTLLNGDDLVYNISNTSEIVTVRGLAELVASLCLDKDLRVVVDIPEDRSKKEVLKSIKDKVASHYEVSKRDHINKKLAEHHRNFYGFGLFKINEVQSDYLHIRINSIQDWQWEET
jgi:nucleoside-diphosphate-sugar epimerase